MDHPSVRLTAVVLALCAPGALCDDGEKSPAVKYAVIGVVLAAIVGLGYFFMNQIKVLLADGDDEGCEPPPDPAVMAAVETIRKANPDVGIGKIVKLLKDQHPGLKVKKKDVQTAVRLVDGSTGNTRAEEPKAAPKAQPAPKAVAVDRRKAQEAAKAQAAAKAREAKARAAAKAQAEAKAKKAQAKAGKQATSPAAEAELAPSVSALFGGGSFGGAAPVATPAVAVAAAQTQEQAASTTLRKKKKKKKKKKAARPPSDDEDDEMNDDMQMFMHWGSGMTNTKHMPKSHRDTSRGDDNFHVDVDLGDL